MQCWARYLFIAVVSALGIGEMVAACGQKGNLYLPKPETTKTQPKPAASNKAILPPAVETGESLAIDRDIKRASELPASGQ
jgi:predicted small lipoprotein YifL